MLAASSSGGHAGRVVDRDRGDARVGVARGGGPSAPSVISASQASNSSRLRAFCRGRPPITPALQASRTSAGPVTRNIGAQIAGRVRQARIFGSRLMDGLRGTTIQLASPPPRHATPSTVMARLVRATHDHRRAWSRRGAPGGSACSIRCSWFPGTDSALSSSPFLPRKNPSWPDLFGPPMITVERDRGAARPAALPARSGVHGSPALRFAPAEDDGSKRRPNPACPPSRQGAESAGAGALEREVAAMADFGGDVEAFRAEARGLAGGELSGRR